MPAAGSRHARPIRRVQLIGTVIWALGLLTLSVASPGVAAAQTWQSSYDAGLRAFERGDLAAAEQGFLASIKTGPPERGITHLRISQTRGFIPEYYLVLIYNKQQKYGESLKYIGAAERSVNPNGFTSQEDLRRLPQGSASYVAALLLARNDAERGVKGPSADPPSPGRRGGDPPPVVTARDTRQADFTTAIQQATTALSEKRYADARTAAEQARDLSVDNVPVTALLTDITARETRDRFDTAMSEAAKALDARNFAAARNAAGRAKATNIDPKQADDLLVRIDSQDYSSQLNAALMASPFDDSRVTGLARQLAAVDAANPLLARVQTALTAATRDRLDAQRALDIRTVTNQINAQLKARAFAALGPLAARLEALDPVNPLIRTAYAAIATNVSADAQLRIGIASFYRGEYQSAINLLGAIDSAARPRAGLYVAASRAALSLLATDPTGQAVLRQQAADAMAPIRPRSAEFTADIRFLSPKVVDLLGLQVR